MGDQERWPQLVAPTGLVTILGCGARSWADCGAVSRTLEPLRAAFPQLTVIEGGAPGADTCVAQWAAGVRARGVHWIHVPARWGEYDTAMRWKAGRDRNAAMRAMLEAARDGHGHTVACVAFKARLDRRLFGTQPSTATGGSEDMIRQAWTADIAVWHAAGVGHAIRRLRPAGQLF